MTNSKSNFLFIVFKDPFVLGIIQFLRMALGSRINDQPHITIQGPFSDRITAERVAVVKRALCRDEILLANPKCFESGSKIVLYMSATSAHMANVWNKPDYPIEKFGFNPHVTIYEGLDKRKVHTAIRFLAREPIELICREFDVVPYVSKQMEMFAATETPSDEFAFQRLLSRGKVGSTFRARFLAALNSPAT